VRHPAPLPEPNPVPLARVGVVGGGIAGLAAACALAERGVQVVLLEAHPELGGRVRSWPVTLADGTTTTMSRGFHAFFRQYYTLRALLRRADPNLSRLVALTDYPLSLPDGTTDSFTHIPRTPPLNMLAFVARSPSFTVRELARVNVAAALELLDVSFPRTFSDYDGVSAADFLDRLRFPAKARHLSLEVFARSFFAHPTDFSAGELVAMFHSYFLGSAEGLVFDVPDDDYDTALWSPLAGYLRRLGVDIRTGVRVSAITGEPTDEARPGGATGQVMIHTGDDRLCVDAVVLATDTAGTARLIAGSGLGTEGWRARVESRRCTPPFVVWRLWFDTPVAPGTPPFLGTSGFGPLDNVSVLDSFEAGARDWARDQGGSVVEVHAYAIDEPPDVVRDQLRENLFEIHPELREATVVDQRWLVADDCPLISTDPWAARPGVVTPDPRLVLAGDGVRCELPVALMERAAVTGFQAANTLLARAGLVGHELWTVPMTGRHRVSAPARRALAAVRSRRG
jgi:isorenieratene synthase